MQRGEGTLIVLMHAFKCLRTHVLRLYGSRFMAVNMLHPLDIETGRQFRDQRSDG